MSPRVVCSVVADECEAPAGIRVGSGIATSGPGLGSARFKCLRCGEAVCGKCSKVRRGRRICESCQRFEHEDLARDIVSGGVPTLGVRITVDELADAIRARWPSLSVRVDAWSETPTRKPQGLRYATRAGKRRDGKRLVVSDGKFPSTVLLDHRTTDPYRRNVDILTWMREYEQKTRTKRGRANKRSR